VELRCPNCGTRFRIDAELLRANGSVVRCSMCNTRFRAYPDPAKPPELIERGEPQPEPASGPAPAAEEESEPEEDKADEAPPTEAGPGGDADDAGAAEAEESEEGEEAAEPGEDAPDEVEEEEAEETPRQRKKREKAERKAAKAQEKEQAKAAKAEAKAEKKAQKGGWGRFFVKLVVALLILALLGELAYLFRVRLLGYEQPRAIAERVRDELRQRYDVDWRLPIAVTRYRIEGLKARQVELPAGKKITVLRGSLVNTATFDQRTPRISVEALGSGNRTLYRRTLVPGKPFDAASAAEQGETTLNSYWRSARDEFPDGFDPGQARRFQLILEGVPPGVSGFSLEMVN
jgi:predicted Zn finger-like uncharacterized protein